jgi:hypothetical protein
VAPPPVGVKAMDIQTLGAVAQLPTLVPFDLRRWGASRFAKHPGHRQKTAFRTTPRDDANRR